MNNANGMLSRGELADLIKSRNACQRMAVYYFKQAQFDEALQAQASCFSMDQQIALAKMAAANHFMDCHGAGEAMANPQVQVLTQKAWDERA